MVLNDFLQLGKLESYIKKKRKGNFPSDHLITTAEALKSITRKLQEFTTLEQ